MSSKVLTLVNGHIQQSTALFLQTTGDNVAFTNVDNIFSVAQGIRSGSSGVAAGLYVPWVTGDSLASLVAGSTNTGNAQTGVTARTGSGLAIYANAATGTPIFGERSASTATNILVSMLALKHTAATPANTLAGFGAAILFQLNSTTTAGRNAGQVGAVWSDPADATFTSDLVFLNALGGAALVERMRLTGAGKLLLRTVDASQSAGLYIPWVSGDGLPTAVFGSSNLSNNQTAIQATSSSGSAIVAYSATGLAIEARLNTALTNTAPTVLSLNHQTSGVVANDFGVGLLFRLQSSTTVDQSAAQIISAWSDFTHATRSAYLAFLTQNNALGLTERMRLTSAGSLGIGTSSPDKKVHIASSVAGDSLYMGYSAPSFMLGNNAVFASVTMVGFLALATAAGNYGASAGDVLLCAQGNSRRNIIINSNYSGTGTTDLILQPGTGNIGIGTGATAPRAQLDVGGAILSTDYHRIEGYTTPVTGQGLELGFSANIGYVQSYSRTSTLWRGLVLGGLTVSLQGAGTTFLTGDANGTDISLTDTATAAATPIINFFHRTSGVPTANFGGDIALYLNSSTTADRPALLLRTIWATATDASRKARLNMYIYDTTNRLAIQMEASGAAAMIGFLGAGAIVRQSVNAASSDLATVVALTNQIRTALIAFGLLA